MFLLFLVMLLLAMRGTVGLFSEPTALGILNFLLSIWLDFI